MAITLTREELANFVRAAKTVETNARELQIQIENLSEYADRWVAGGLVEAVERAQEVVHELATYRNDLELAAAKTVANRPKTAS